MKRDFKMLSTPSFLLVVLFITISLSLGFGGAKESEGHLHSIHGFYNIPRRLSTVTVVQSECLSDFFSKFI